MLFLPSLWKKSQLVGFIDSRQRHTLLLHNCINYQLTGHAGPWHCVLSAVWEVWPSGQKISSMATKVINVLCVPRPLVQFMLVRVRNSYLIRLLPSWNHFHLHAFSASWVSDITMRAHGSHGSMFSFHSCWLMIILGFSEWLFKLKVISLSLI